MIQVFQIPARLPSLNEMIAANRRNKYAGAKLKRDTEEFIIAQIFAQKLAPVERPCIVHMVFNEPNRKRDADNVESAKKFILDALVRAKVIAGDSPKYVVASPSFTVYEHDSAFVTVTIVEGERGYLHSLLRTASETIIGADHGRKIQVPQSTP